MPTIQFQLNGAAMAVEADPDQTLLDVLRGRLGVTSPHFGCGAGECGACHVMVDGRAMTSCDMPMWSLADKNVVTVEGLGTMEEPHPLQLAFIAEQAMQCGYCINGMIMSAKALLDKTPRPTEAQIRDALAGNLCRCGSHNRIVRAIERASKEMAT
jgi:nicotinate dehydrogenase subunit A